MDAAEPKRYGHTLYDDFALERVEGVDDDEVILERFVGSQPSRWYTMAEVKEDGGFSPVETRLVPTADTRGAAIPAQGVVPDTPQWDTRGAAVWTPPASEPAVAPVPAPAPSEGSAAS